MTNQVEENALRIYIEKIEKENELLRKFASVKGFYDEYFAELPKVSSNKEAFDNVNELYYSLHGKYKYSDYNAFKRITNYYNNKSK
ncbi:hypothetical protein [Flavobacterium sp. UGB4466]|uniref:hypothetical protein n=1 Tax=Flavobacterium sp. UGB4466 TaxID=2730889 RepID=UPI00192B4D49|nr:hypothetical protein [Flavobacterium sp. UGB4466]